MGTGSSKGVLVTPDGVVLATEQIDHQISMPRPGWARGGRREDVVVRGL